MTLKKVLRSRVHKTLKTLHKTFLVPPNATYGEYPVDYLRRDLPQTSHRLTEDRLYLYDEG